MRPNLLFDKVINVQYHYSKGNYGECWKFLAKISSLFNCSLPLSTGGKCLVNRTERTILKWLTKTIMYNNFITQIKGREETILTVIPALFTYKCTKESHQ